MFWIPYMGCKAKIADPILAAIRVTTSDCKERPFFDLFTGGGSIGLTAIHSRFFKSVFLNDIEPGLIDLHEYLKTGNPNELWGFVTKEEFNAVKNADTRQGAFYRSVWAFGNAGQSYVYGYEIAPVKALLHEFVVSGSVVALIYGINLLLGGLSPEMELYLIKMAEAWNKNQTIWWNYQNVYKPIVNREEFKDIRGLEHLNRIQHIVDIMDMYKENSDIKTVLSCGSYSDVMVPENGICYCDPPYKGTSKYKSGDFNHDEFWEWVKKCKFPVFVSEYSAPEEFVPILTINKGTGMRGSTKETFPERLYWNGIK